MTERTEHAVEAGVTERTETERTETAEAEPPTIELAEDTAEAEPTVKIAKTEKTATTELAPPDDTAEETAEPAAEEKAEPGADKTDNWDAFAPTPVPPPSRARATGGAIVDRIGQFVGHEWTLAAAGSLVLAAVMTWPTLRYPTATIPQDIWDPTLQAWQMAWGGHALLTQPDQLWHANAFHPEQYSYAFSDTLLGYAPLGAIGSGPVAAILRYNIIFVLIFALALFGGYVLVRQLGAGRTGALVAGAAFAFSPWRLGQAGHLHVLSIGGIALALAMLARGHGWSLRHGYRPEHTRWGWALAGWLVAAWQISLGFGIGLPFAYILAGIVLAAAVTWAVRFARPHTRKPFPLRLLFANLGGGLVFAGTGAAMAYPYLKVIEQHPYARRSEELLSLFSPPLNGFFVAPPESWLWGGSHAEARAALPWAPEMALLPGFFLFGLAIAGLFVSIWRVRHRILLGAGVVVSIALAMGTNGPDRGELGYLLFYRALPGLDGIRTPGRLVLWTTLLLAVLAAGAVSAFVVRAAELRADETAPLNPALRLLTLLPLALVLVEGAHQTPHPIVPTAPIAMSTIDGPAMILPSDELQDMNVMLWTTDGFPRVVNGGSGFGPQRQAELREVMKSFPDQASVEALKAIGVRTVVVIRNRALGSPYENAIDAPIDDLELERTETDDVILYRVG